VVVARARAATSILCNRCRLRLRHRQTQAPEMRRGGEVGPDHTHLTAAGFARNSVADAGVAQDSDRRRRLSSASRQGRLQNEHEHGCGAGGLGGEEEDRGGGGGDGDPETLSCLPAESMPCYRLCLQRPAGVSPQVRSRRWRQLKQDEKKAGTRSLASPAESRRIAVVHHIPLAKPF
jgi:hypothetical protein